MDEQKVEVVEEVEDEFEDECIVDRDCNSNKECFENECILLECDEDEIVENHNCVEKEEVVPDCATNNDCEEGEVCQGQQCILPEELSFFTRLGIPLLIVAVFVGLALFLIFKKNKKRR